MRIARLASFGFILAALPGCSGESPAPSVPTAGSAQAIIDGELERGEDGVVLLYFQNGSTGGLCTGTVIAPRVVLTAKHCTQGFFAENFVVAVGPNPGFRPVRTYRVSEIRTTDGSALDGRDIAVLLLASDAAETPYALATGRPARGADVTLIGYGQTADTDGGTKYRAIDQVVYVQSTEFVTSGHGACHGDSGGPTFDADGRVVGVMVRADCMGSTVHTRVDTFLDELIYPALRDTGVCVPTGDGVEVCNGIDDDCDGQVDEVCQPLGAECTDDASCLEGACLDAPSGARICTEPCDPFASACRDGFVCRRTGCGEGLCVPGTAGARADGETCGDDGDCASLHCIDPGDGARRCLAPCRDGDGSCGPRFVCAIEGGSACGGCLPEVGRAGPFGHGETCVAPADCRAGLECVDDGGVSYCARACSATEACPTDYHCRAGRCLRGGPLPDGDPCVGNEDCASGLCAAERGETFCTSVCSGADACSTGMECRGAGTVSVCAPVLAAVGERCAESADCLTGLCASGVCTRLCGHGVGDCPSGTTCLPVSGGGGARACTPNEFPSAGDGGGCSVASGSGRLPSGSAALALLGLAWLVVRRRARRPR